MMSSLIFFSICPKCSLLHIRTVRNLVGKHRTSFLGVVETKHRRSFNNRLRRLWGNDDFGLCEVFASDTYAGGILTVWDTGVLNVENMYTGDRWIILEGIVVSSNFACCICVLYGPHERLDRLVMFEEIKNVLSSINKPVIMLGDFNVILNSAERVGVFRCELSSRDFRDWIQDLGVVDLPLHDISFTWRRNGSTSRLDRVLCCNEWLRHFPNLVLRGEKRHLSDHNPLVLLLDDRTDW